MGMYMTPGMNTTQGIMGAMPRMGSINPAMNVGFSSRSFSPATQKPDGKNPFDDLVSGAFGGDSSAARFGPTSPRQPSPRQVTFSKDTKVESRGHSRTPSPRQLNGGNPF